MSRIPGTTFHDSDPPPTLEEAKALAQTVYQIRQLLAGYLGDKQADPAVVKAAHLAYAHHNLALAILDRHFEPSKGKERCHWVHTHGMLCHAGGMNGIRERCTLEINHEGECQFPGGPCSKVEDDS